MVNFPGRNDRRRRVLKEEVLSASSSHASIRSGADSDAAGQALRYSEAASVENHPQVTDFVPRRYGTIALLVLFGVASTASLAAMHYFVLPLAELHGMRRAAAFDLAAQGNLADWLGAVVLFVASGLCIMTYSLRRHRIDDIRGRYRIWLGAALACLLLSANSVAGLHRMIADVLTYASGWTALRDGAAWWLAVAGLPLAWILLRILFDMRECRVGTILLVGGLGCYAASAAGYFGYVHAIMPGLESIQIAVPLLLGHWLVFAAIVANARFVVLDAQGLVAARRRSSVRQPAATSAIMQVATSSAAPTANPKTTIASVRIARQTLQQTKTPADSDKWVDGRRHERDRYDDNEDEDSSGGDNKLSKSERKRMRKLKAQSRAA